MAQGGSTAKSGSLVEKKRKKNKKGKKIESKSTKENTGWRMCGMER
jgi:hypothetical protein